MVFPDRPTGNAWQLIGQSFNQGAGIVNDLSTQQNALQALVERRTQAALEQKRLEREQAAKDWELQQKKDDAEKQQKFLDAAAKMKEKGVQLPEVNTTIPASTRNIGYPSNDVAIQQPRSIGEIAAPQLGYAPALIPQVVNQAQTVTTPGGYRPAIQQDYADLALQNGQLTPKDYLEPSPYEKAKATMEGSIAGGALDKIAAGQRDRFITKDIGGRQVKINLDTNEQTDLGSSEKPMTPYQRASLERLNNMPVGGALNNRSLMTDSRAARTDYEKAAKPYLALKGIVKSPAYGTGLGDQSMIDKLIIIETGKVPTEAQYFQVAKNLGIEDKIDKLTGRIKTGEIMGPKARANLMAQAEEQMRISHDAYNSDYSQFTDMARENGANPAAVSRRGGAYEMVDKYLGGTGYGPDLEPANSNRTSSNPKTQPTQKRRVWNPATGRVE
jgi:hypothetical protein